MSIAENVAALRARMEAAALAAGLSYAKALQLAAAASALAVQKRGAAPSIPMRAEVEAYLQGE